MTYAICWVPKGVCKNVPEIAEPPTKEEAEEILKSLVLGGGGDDEDRDEEMDVDVVPVEEDEVPRALAAAEALGKTEGKRSFSDPQYIVDGLAELDMDHYDDEEDDIPVFTGGPGDAYYRSNDEDPYLKKNDDDDDDDSSIEDMAIKSTDSVIVCARCEKKACELEVWVLEEFENGDTNMYVHHAIMLADLPLCTAWLDCKPKSGEKGNFIAVGSTGTAIEIRDLDLLDEVKPFMVLGGVSQKKKIGKKTSVKYKNGSHRDSVLDLAWNKEVRNVLASASADKSVKVWDVVKETCAVSMKHHTDKVQSVAWSRQSPEILLTGSVDRSILMMDVRASTHPSKRWSVAAGVESLAWDPHNENSFAVSLDNNTVQGFDIRTTAMDSSSGSKPSFTLDAHDKAVNTISYNPSAANLLATGSDDNMVKLWDLSNNQPSCVSSRNPGVGAVISVSFCEDSPFLLGIGGYKGKLEVWNTSSNAAVANRFGKFSNGSIKPAPLTLS